MRALSWLSQGEKASYDPVILTLPIDLYSFDHDTRNPTTVLYDEKEVTLAYRHWIMTIGTFSRQMFGSPATTGIAKDE
jgi:hypothetical protein